MTTRLPVRGTNIVLGMIVLAWSGIAWQQTSYWRDSETLFRHTLAVNPTSQPILDNLVVVTYQEQRYDEALELAQRSYAQSPKLEKAQLGLGRVLQSLNRHDEAISVLQPAVEQNPLSPALRRALATSLIQQGQIDAAKQQYEAMLQLDKNNAAAALGLASLAVQQQDHATAERIYRDLSAAPPQDAELRVTLADLAIICGDRATAREHYQTALTGNVNRGNVWFKIGQLEFSEQKWQPARDAMHEALRLGNHTPDAHRYLAAIYSALQQPRQANEQYRALLAVAPDDRMALNNLAWALATTEAGGAAGGAENGTEAVRLAEHLCQLEPMQAGALDTLAAAYAQAGRFADAIRTARQAIDLAAQAGDTSLAVEIRGRLERYGSNRPYREQPAANAK